MCQLIESDFAIARTKSILCRNLDYLELGNHTINFNYDCDRWTAITFVYSLRPWPGGQEQKYFSSFILQHFLDCLEHSYDVWSVVFLSVSPAAVMKKT